MPVHRLRTSFLRHLLTAVSLLCLLPGVIHSQAYTSRHITMKDGLPGNRINDMIKDSKSLYWLATDAGLVKWYSNTFETLGIEQGLPSLNISTLSEDGDGNIWLGVAGKGIIKFDGKNFSTIVPHDSLPGETNRLFYSPKWNIILVATNNGFVAVTGNNYTVFIPEPQIVGKAPINVTWFLDTESFIYVHTYNNGPFAFQPGHADNVVPVKFWKENVSIRSSYITSRGDTIWSLTNNSVIYSGQRSNAGFFILKENHEISFIDHYNTNLNDFSLADSNLLILHNPNSLRLAQINNNDAILHNLSAESPVNLGSSVMREEGLWLACRWWQTWWFYILSALFLIVIFWVVLLLRVKHVRKTEFTRLTLDREINELRIKALQAQMNPHFTFNAINSIQYFIINNDKESAFDFINYFSKLIRQTLERASRLSVTIKEEVQFIENYIKLEQMRFEKKFTYEIQVDPELDSHQYHIPPMLLQPFVENAILHGILHKDEPGMIKIIFRISGDKLLHCIVEDNGIGRHKSAIINKGRHKGHKSVGIEITKRRVGLMNDPGQTDYKVVITDLHDNLSPSGTSVLIKIPLISENSQNDEW